MNRLERAQQVRDSTAWRSIAKEFKLKRYREMSDILTEDYLVPLNVSASLQAKLDSENYVYSLQRVPYGGVRLSITDKR